MKKILTFLSDFGVKDNYAAQVKGRILSETPDVSIIDITHECERFSIISGAWLLHTSWRYFPENTIHLAVVDPGVGTDRAILAVQKDGHFFIGPDNGIFSFIYPAERVFEITWRPRTEISCSFHARDIMAPVSAMLLNGIQPAMLGTPKQNPVLIDTEAHIVVHIDSFGNIITNVGYSLLSSEGIMINDTVIKEIAGAYDDIKGNVPAIIKSCAGTIEVSSKRQSAAEILKAKPGMPVIII